MVKSAVSFDWFHSEGLTSGYFDPKMVGLCRTDVEEARLGVGAFFESRQQDLLATPELNRIPSQLVSFF